MVSLSSFNFVFFIMLVLFLFLKSFLKICLCYADIIIVLTFLSTLASRLIDHISNLLSLFGNFNLVAFRRNFHNAGGM